MSTNTDYKFKGWVGLSADCIKNGSLVEQELQVKPFDEKNDVDIKVTHCGICGSDLHTLRSGWRLTAYPACVGHEIVGKAVRVGSDVKNIKIGDRVGVGAQSSACLKPDCEECESNNENYCPHMVGTYGSRYPDGSLSYGGYSDYARVPSHFVFKIPDLLPSESAAPMLCGGITMYSPLKRYGCGPGKNVGIIGIGGLGHFGVMFAKALGASKVVAISRKSNKASDALKMGADAFIATAEDETWDKRHANTLDLIISTVNSPEMPLARYLQILKYHGTFVQVGAPEDNVPGFNMLALIFKGCKVAGSMIGSPADIQEMLDLAVKKGVRAWSNPVPLTKCNEALQAFERGEPRYRTVLVNEKHAKI